jgi:hypothetical protein
MRIWKSAIAGAVMLLLSGGATAHSGMQRAMPAQRSWAAIGVGVAPSPYGLDGNGSPLGDFAVGHGTHHRISVVGSVTRYEFGGRTVAKFTQLAIGVRAHLAPNHASLGGPYLGVAPVLCHVRFREWAGTSNRLLPGLEATVGAEIPLTSSFAIDWSASHVITPDAAGLSPDPVTHSTKRDGLDRGAMRIRLVLAR